MDKLDKVTAEYVRNKELTKQDVEVIKKWIEKQPHLPTISEFQIILFLHSCYYRLEPTKACIESFYTARAHCPEFFQNRNPRIYGNDIFEPMLMMHLPRATPEGYQIVFLKFINLDASRFTLPNAFKSLDMGAMLSLHVNGTAPGHILLIDLKGMAFGHLTKFNPSYIMKFFFYLQEALPFRLKGFYYFNIPPFMDKIMAMLKPYLKSDLLNVVNDEELQLFTDNMDDLYKLVPQECFPSDYGGQAPSVSELIEIRKQIYFENEQFFVDGEKEIADESKRVGKLRHGQEVFGMDGTFKKLEID